MSTARLQAVEALSSWDIPFHLITEDNLHQWVVDDHPISSAWWHLSAMHKADYLRCYLMHHHGGGYTDIKFPTGPWRPCFGRMEVTNAWAAGYQEFWWGVASLGSRGLGGPRLLDPRWRKYRLMQLRYRKLIGNGAFIFRPRTPLTMEWLIAEDAVLAALGAALSENPAQQPVEYKGPVVNGRPTGYPVAWSQLGGDVMQPLILRYATRVIRGVPVPNLTNYR